MNRSSATTEVRASVLDCASPLALSTARKEESARGLAHSKTRRQSLRLPIFVDAPRWLLLAALLFAPWAYGCTRPWASNTLALILDAVVLLWLADCLIRCKRPEIPMLPLVAVIALLTQGWWMALNPKSHFDPEHLALIPNASVLSSRPGSIDGHLSVANMFVVTAILGALLFVIDLATRPVWRNRLWLTIAFGGVSIGLFGIIQKIGGESILAWTWEPEKIQLENNFAMFRYRGNAAAFLNLVAPIIFGITLETFRKRDSHWMRAGCAAALVVIVAAIQLNPSRAGWGIAVLIAAIIALAFGWRMVSRIEYRADFWRWSVLAAAFVAALAAICWIGGWRTSWSRVLAQGIDPSNRSPTEIYLSMVPDAGLLGFGPGTFQAIFPSYQLTYDFGSRVVPDFWITHNWTQAHNDYLQTLIEWGHVGAAFWALLFLGALWRAAVVTARSNDRNSSHHHRLLIGCSLLALIGVLIHAAVDFPLQIPSLEFYIAVVLALCWSQSPIRQSHKNVDNS